MTDFSPGGTTEGTTGAPSTEGMYPANSSRLLYNQVLASCKISQSTFRPIQIV